MTFSRTQELSLLRYRCRTEIERTGRFEMFSEAIRFICNRVPKQHMLSAQLVTVMKAGGLGTEHGSVIVLQSHHKLYGQGIKDELVWRV